MHSRIVKLARSYAMGRTTRRRWMSKGYWRRSNGQKSRHLDAARRLGKARPIAGLIVERRLDFGLRVATGQRRQRWRSDVTELRLENTGALESVSVKCSFAFIHLSVTCVVGTI